MLHVKLSYFLLSHSWGVVFKRYTLISPIWPRPSGPWGSSTFIYTKLILLPPSDVSHQILLHSVEPFLGNRLLKDNVDRRTPDPLWPLGEKHLHLFKIDSPSLSDASHQIWLHSVELFLSIRLLQEKVDRRTPHHDMSSLLCLWPGELIIVYTIIYLKQLSKNIFKKNLFKTLQTILYKCCPSYGLSTLETLCT